MHSLRYFSAPFKTSQAGNSTVKHCYSTNSSSVFNIFSRKKSKEEALKKEQLKKEELLAEENLIKEEEEVLAETIFVLKRLILKHLVIF